MPAGSSNSEISVRKEDAGREGGGANLGRAEPVSKVEVEITIAIGPTTVASTITGSKSGGVGLVGSVAVEGGGGAILDVDSAAAAISVGVILDIVVAYGIVTPPSIQHTTKQSGGVVDLVFEAVVFGIAGGGVWATVASSGAVLDRVGPSISN